MKYFSYIRKKIKDQNFICNFYIWNRDLLKISFILSVVLPLITSFLKISKTFLENFMYRYILSVNLELNVFQIKKIKNTIFKTNSIKSDVFVQKDNSRTRVNRKT